MAAGLQHFPEDPTRVGGCSNFNNQVCVSFATSSALGYPTKRTIGLVRHASVALYMSRIRIPTLLIPGEADSLFDLQEAIATYRSLRASTCRSR